MPMLRSGFALAVGLGVLVGALGASRTARAVVVSEDELADTSTEVGVITREFSFVLGGDTLEPPFLPEDANPAALSILDLRTYFSYRSETLRLVWHQANDAVVASHENLGVLRIGRGGLPPRLFPLRATPVDEPTLRLATETDWLYAAWAPGRVTVTVGRQPITLGRGQLFHPLDLVASFSLTEADTEYKPGADAVRVDASLGSTTTLTAVASGGQLGIDPRVKLEDRGSTALGVLKQGFGHGEFSLLSGFVRGDIVAGWGALWDLGALDLYGEVSATWVRDPSLSSPAVAGRKAAVPRALAGADLKPIPELTIAPELYYEGFGAREPRDYALVAVSERVVYGEQVALGRLYAGALVDWQPHPLFHLVAVALSNTLDPSALASLVATFDASPNTRLSLGGYLPLGAAPRATPFPEPRSEYGLYPSFGFAELRIVL